MDSKTLDRLQRTMRLLDDLANDTEEPGMVDQAHRALCELTKGLEDHNDVIEGWEGACLCRSCVSDAT